MPPRGLQKAGKGLWLAVTDEFDLAGYEKTLLLEACRCVDLCGRLQRIVVREGPVVPWQGSTRINLAVTALRQNRVVLARLLGALDVPDSDETVYGARRRRRAS